MKLYKILVVFVALTLSLSSVGWAQKKGPTIKSEDGTRRSKRSKKKKVVDEPVAAKRLNRTNSVAEAKEPRSPRIRTGTLRGGEIRSKADLTNRPSSEAPKGGPVGIQTSISTPSPTPPPPGKGEPEGMTLPGEKEFNECVKIPAHRRVKITLKQESDLMDLVAWISSMTCKKFIVATTLRSQKVTIISPTPVTAAEAYRAFLSSLEVLGLTVAPVGQYLKIVQSNFAIQSSIPTYNDKDHFTAPLNDAFITQLVRVESADANEVAGVLNKVKTRNGDISIYKPTNTLILTDSAMIVKRMMDLVKELDVPVEGEKIWVVPLKNADADEVNKILTTIFSPKGPSPRPIVAGRPGSPPEEDVNTLSASKIVVDMASNSLIIVANATSFARIASLIKKLDVESDGVNQKINVYNLANGDAETMANTLGTLTGASVRNPGKRGTHGQNPRPPGGGAAVLFEAEVKISADKPTNSLVIVASPRDYLNLRGVIQKLDIPRRQVFVEATIMEISMNKNRKLGMTYHGAGKTGEGDSETLIFGGSEFGTDFNSLLMNPASLTGLAVGARTQPISGSGKFLGMSVDIPAFSVMLQAMQNNGDVNVLSSPHILTTDNEQAEITVGQNVPYPSGYSGVSSLASAAGSQASSLASLLPTVSVQRMDVALKLKLTPHVNESDMVRLELEQEVSDIIQENYNNLGPATSKRSAKTTIVARDQQTVVIGGLMSDRVNNSETKIPILGDIPIIGYFFKNTTKSLQKTNLLLVLTPYVIRDQSDLRRIFQKKEEERREFIERYTSFKPHDLGHEIDYRHKRGLLGEIYKVSEQIEQENKLLQDAHKKLQDTSEPVEMPNLPAPSSTGTPTPGDQNASPPTSIERMPPPTSIERMPSPVAPEMPRLEPQIQQ